MNPDQLHLELEPCRDDIDELEHDDQSWHAWMLEQRAQHPFSDGFAEWWRSVRSALDENASSVG